MDYREAWEELKKIAETDGDLPFCRRWLLAKMDNIEKDNGLNDQCRDCYDNKHYLCTGLRKKDDVTKCFKTTR